MNKEQIEAINIAAEEAYTYARMKGFHDGEVVGKQTSERVAIFIANLHGECSELWEAARKDMLDQLCDKNCGLTNAEEELADIVIRALDTAHSLGVSIGSAIDKKMVYNNTRPYKHGKLC